MSQTKVSIIAAMDQKRGIGKNNRLLWNIPQDLKRFRELTSGHPVIMGRKTFESIISYSGKPLSNRTNIVITHNTSFPRSHPGSYEGVLITRSLEEALRLAKNPGVSIGRHPRGVQIQEIFIIGGGQIYQQSLSLADKLYLTIVEGEFDADTFFPEYEHLFKKVVFEQEGEWRGYKYKFLELKRS